MGILDDVSDVIEDEQVLAVEFGDRGFERQLAPRRLQALDKIGRAGEQDAPSVFDESEPNRRTQVAFPATRRSKTQQVSPCIEPDVA
jgi:hypothetical protein